ncbi:hypothetical protein BH11ACT2_BH11ACT2_08370 [soil metagenome]
MAIFLVLVGILAVVAVVATVRDLRFDGYRRKPSRESTWGSEFQGRDRR